MTDVISQLYRLYKGRCPELTGRPALLIRWCLVGR